MDQLKHQNQAMTTSNIPQVASKIYELLRELSEEEQRKALDAALIFLGRPVPTSGSTATPSVTPAHSLEGKTPAPANNAKDYFSNKAPQSKVEQLAVAARYRETHLHQESNSKEDLQAVFKEARVNFDAKHYKRDIENAKVQGFFNRGPENQLSYYGQNFVDALPDREAARNIQKPRTGSAAKKRTSTQKHAGRVKNRPS